MIGLSTLDPANPPELRRYEKVDPDILLNVTESCRATNCSLQRGHAGPHADINPYTGMIYELWGMGGDTVVSKAALSVARQINEARDNAIEAIDEARRLQFHCRNQYLSVTKEQDPILRMLLDHFSYWPDSSYSLEDSGFEAVDDDDLMQELIEIYEEEMG